MREALRYGRLSRWCWWCAASITQEDRLAVCDLTEKRENTSVIVGRAMNHRTTCMMAAPITMKLNWTTMFSY